ncbi:MAG: integrin alpha [Pseudomonadota bacterium]
MHHITLSRGASALALAVIIAATPAVAVEFLPTTLDNPDPQPNAGFGHAMAGVGDIDGDGTADFLVGARFQDVDGNTDQGRVYLYSGADLSVLRTIENPVPQSGASFGRWVSRAGDVDRDGVPDLFVGTPFQTIDGNFQQGFAHLFSGATGELIYEFNDPEGQPAGHYGLSVSGVGDLNDDQVPDLFVGAHFKDIDGSIDQGEAYIYDGATGELTLTLTTPEPVAGAFYGFPVDKIGDVNGDGTADLLIGAVFYPVDGNLGQGRAFVQSGVDGSIIHILDTPNPQPNGGFGRSLEAINDINGDSVPDIVVGAHLHAVDGKPGVGQVFVYSGASGDLLMTIDSPEGAKGAWFGLPVSSTADVDGDGTSDILVGAAFERGNTPYPQGRAYIFSGASGRLVQVLRNPEPQAGAQFGFKIEPVGGDLNGDGVPDLLVGAFRHDVEAPAQHLGMPQDAMPAAHCPMDRLPARRPLAAPGAEGNENAGRAFVYLSSPES